MPEFATWAGMTAGPLKDLGVDVQREIYKHCSQEINGAHRLCGFLGQSRQGVWVQWRAGCPFHSRYFGIHVLSVILETPMINQVVQVIKESEIDKLAIPWARIRGCTLLQVHLINVQHHSRIPWTPWIWMRLSLFLVGSAFWRCSCHGIHWEVVQATAWNLSAHYGQGIVTGGWGNSAVIGCIEHIHAHWTG